MWIKIRPICCFYKSTFIFLKDIYSLITGETPAINHKKQTLVSRGGDSVGRQGLGMSLCGFVPVLPQLTVQTAGFIVLLGPAGAALVDSLLLHPVHLLVNRVVARPVGTGGSESSHSSHPTHCHLPAAPCTHVSHLWDFFQPPSGVLVKNEANTANCILMLCPHIILKNLYSS